MKNNIIVSKTSKVVINTNTLIGIIPLVRNPDVFVASFASPSSVPYKLEISKQDASELSEIISKG